MGLHQIKEELLKHANEEAKNNNYIAEQKANEIILTEKEKLLAKEDLMLFQIEKEFDSLEKKELAANNLEIRKYLYEKKTELIKKVFTDSREELQNLSKKEKAALITALLKKAEKELSIATVYCNQADKELIKNYNVIQESTITAGIIVENKEKTVRIDYTVDSFMKNIEEKKLQEVATLLLE